jgi:hypothetical protein
MKQQNRIKMKFKIQILFILFSISSFSQSLCRTDIMNEEELNAKNEVTEFIKYDFSELWLKTENSLVYGIIGNEYQRILIKFLTVEKNLINNNEYFVFGKSSVKGNFCEFIGKITILKIQESKRKHFGVDDEFKNQGIKTQGLLTAKYEFFENKHQNHSGYFSGTLQTKWFLDKNDKVQYDDINSVSDGYFNNAFVGTWKMYNSNIEKICNWGDYRVPYANCDFDIGTGELSISEKYLKNGWWVKPKQKWW